MYLIVGNYYGVSIAEQNNNSSLIGRQAEGANENEATMWLDLHNIDLLQDDMEAKRRVMHEFGHALGLQHEHQRGDFWSYISDFVEMGRMQSDIRSQMKPMTDAEFDHYWKTQWSAAPALHLVEDQTGYDRPSIMHYL
jgi:hypothetical protein